MPNTPIHAARVKTYALSLVLTFMLLCMYSSFTYSYHSSSDFYLPDTIELPPNTIQVIAVVNKMHNHEVTITILTVKGQGQGIINTLSEGEEVVLIAQRNTKNLKGKKIEAFLREKLEMDASQSSYSLTRFKEL